MTLAEVVTLLAQYADGTLPREALEARLAIAFAEDPLGAGDDDARWEADHDSERLLWRLLYLFSGAVDEGEGDDALRTRARRVTTCLSSTRSPATCYELLPLVLDQDRFTTIVARHRSGVISRTGFLSVVAESGYADHAKLWLQHASVNTLGQLCERLERGEYGAVAAAMERAPGR